MSNSSSEENSSNISSVKDSENISSQLNSKKTITKDKEKNMSNDLKEKILTYIKIDDMIRKKRDEMKELNDKKKSFEEILLKYMGNNDATYFNVPGGKLIKNESETSGTLKQDIIKDAIIEGIKKEKLTDTDDANKKIIDNIFNIMEEKRGKVTNINLKRTFERSSKPKSKPKSKK